MSLLLPALSAMSSGPVYVRTPWNNCRLAQFVPKARRVRGETPEQLQEKDRQREDMVDVVNMMSSNPALGSALKPIAVSMVERWRAEQGINPMGPHFDQVKQVKDIPNLWLQDFHKGHLEISDAFMNLCVQQDPKVVKKFTEFFLNAHLTSHVGPRGRCERALWTAMSTWVGYTGNRCFGVGQSIGLRGCSCFKNTGCFGKSGKYFKRAIFVFRYCTTGGGPPFYAKSLIVLRFQIGCSSIPNGG